MFGKPLGLQELHRLTLGELIQNSIVDTAAKIFKINCRAFGTYLDGGLIANNPTLDVLTEVQEYNSVVNALGAGSTTQPMIVVSLGTGCKPTEQVIIKLSCYTLKFLTQNTIGRYAGSFSPRKFIGYSASGFRCFRFWQVAGRTGTCILSFSIS